MNPNLGAVFVLGEFKRDAEASEEDRNERTGVAKGLQSETIVRAAVDVKLPHRSGELLERLRHRGERRRRRRLAVGVFERTATVFLFHSPVFHESKTNSQHRVRTFSASKKQI